MILRTVKVNKFREKGFKSFCK